MNYLMMDDMESKAINEIIEIDDKIVNELEKDNIDHKEILKLRTKQLMAGLILNTGYSSKNKIY